MRAVYRLTWTLCAVALLLGVVVAGAAPRGSLAGATAALRFQAAESGPYAITGSVTSTFAEAPVANAVLRFWRSDGQSTTLQGIAAAGADGRWRYETTTDDPLYVSVSDPTTMHTPTWFGGPSMALATPVIPARGSEAPWCPVVMQVTQPSTLLGSLKAAAAGPELGPMRVALFRTSNASTPIAETTVDAGGAFAFSDMPGGDYKLRMIDERGIYATGFHRGSTTFTAAEVVRVNAGAQVSVSETMTLVPAHFAGAVVSSTHGIGVPAAGVELWRPSADGWAREATGTADALGRWAISTESTAPVKVRFVDPSGMHDPAWYGGTSLEQATELEPVRAQTISVDRELALVRPGTIEGTVTSSLTGLALPGVAVALGVDGAAYSAGSVTDEHGGYRFEGLAPGTYRTSCEQPDGAYERWPGSGTQRVDVGGPLPVRVDPLMEPVAGADLVRFSEPALAPGSTASPYVREPVGVRVTVSDPSGAPLALARPAVQRSYDLATWETLAEVAVEHVGEGVYETSITAESDLPVHIRFAFVRSGGRFQAFSAPLGLTPHSGATTWSLPVILEHSAQVAYVPRGTPLTIEAALTGYNGQPVEGALVHLQSSLDGTHFTDAPGSPVTALSGGRYRATVVAERKTRYRFVFTPTGWDDPSVSAAATVQTPRRDRIELPKPGAPAWRTWGAK